MTNMLVRNIPPELESAIRELAARKRLTLSAAALELMQSGMAANSDVSDLYAADESPVADFLAETLKEVLHTEDEAEEFIRSHEEPSRRAGRKPVA